MLDTFEGFDNEEHAYDIKKFNFDEKHQTKLFKDTSVDEVKKVVGWNEHCHILKGVCDTNREETFYHRVIFSFK